MVSQPVGHGPRLTGDGMHLLSSPNMLLVLSALNALSTIGTLLSGHILQNQHTAEMSRIQQAIDAIVESSSADSVDLSN
jgi:hypothetical protein